MDHAMKRITNFPLSILFAIIVTAVLFLSLPLLTRMKVTSPSKPETPAVFISSQKPSPPPSLEEETAQKSLVEKEMIRKEARVDRVPRIVSLPGINAAAGKGVVAIDVTPRFGEIKFAEAPTFTAGEVDQPPGLLRSFPPQYPYMAKRDNVQGWVMLRFVVDIEGLARDVAVADASPVGIFEEAAIKAVLRYKFKPAIKDGAPVCCIIKQRIRFELD